MAALAPVIEAKVEPDRAGFAARLARRAKLLARAHGETIVRSRRHDPWRWRMPRLLWPLFARSE